MHSEPDCYCQKTIYVNILIHHKIQEYAGSVVRQLQHSSEDGVERWADTGVLLNV